MQPQIQQSKNPKKIMQRLRLVRIWWTNPNFFGFFVDCRYEEQTRSKLRKNYKISPSNLKIWYHLIEAKVSWCFNEMAAIVFYRSRPCRSDYERARRRAIAIAKPTSEGLLTTPEHVQLDHEGLFPMSKRRTSKKLRLQSGYCEYKMKALLIKVGFCDALVWSLDTNKVREVAAMANF